PSRIKTKVLRSLLTYRCESKTKAKGSIMAAVVVLEIHMDSSAVSTKIASTEMPRCPLDMEMMHMAIFRYSFWRCKYVYSAKPPKNRKITGSAKVAKAACVVIGTSSSPEAIGMASNTAITGMSKAVIVI